MRLLTVGVNMNFVFLDLLLTQEKHGFSPNLQDGKIGGNAAVILKIGHETFLLVSKSGKNLGEMDLMQDMCLIKDFNKESWSCDYYSEHIGTKPTSDAPMHSCLLNLNNAFNISDLFESEFQPTAALHGHALESEETARLLGIPCGTEETLFSTPEDTEAMIKLLRLYPYPRDKVYIRKSHGYYIIGRDLDDCFNVLKEKVLKYI